MGQSRDYHLMDAQWKVNFRGRVNNLAGQYDPTNEKSDQNIVMAIDHISMKTGIHPKWKQV